MGISVGFDSDKEPARDKPAEVATDSIANGFVSVVLVKAPAKREIRLARRVSFVFPIRKDVVAVKALAAFLLRFRHGVSVALGFDF